MFLKNIVSNFFFNFNEFKFEINKLVFQFQNRTRAKKYPNLKPTRLLFPKWTIITKIIRKTLMNNLTSVLKIRICSLKVL